MFDGETVSGPVPTLFAHNPPEALSALNSDPSRAFKDIQRILSKMFVPENISGQRSWSFLNNLR
jgi:hypothetical protein